MSSFLPFFSESVWAQSSSNSRGLYLIFSSSHLLIFTPSHLRIFSSSHLLIFTSSHLHIFSLHIFSSSHLHIFSSSHLLIFTSSHLHIFSSSHLLTSHLLIFTSSHLHIFSSSHLLTFTASHLHSFSSSQLLIFTSSHLLIFTGSGAGKRNSCPLPFFPSCPPILRAPGPSRSSGPSLTPCPSSPCPFVKVWWEDVQCTEPPWTYLNIFKPSWNNACACEQLGTDLWTIEPIGTYRNQVGTNLEPNGTSLCMEELGDGFSFVFVVFGVFGYCLTHMGGPHDETVFPT